MARNATMLSYDFLEITESLTDAECGRLVRALLKYSMSGEVQEFGGNEKYLWPVIKLSEDRYKKSYDDLCDTRKESGKRGGRPKKPNGFSDDENKPNGFSDDENKPNGFSENQTKPNKSKKTYSESESESESEFESEIIKENVKRKAAARFSPPTPDDVNAYIREQGYQVNFEGQYFCDWYAARNWELTKGVKMKDWRAAVRTWVQRDKNRNIPPPPPNDNGSFNPADLDAMYGG